jgi:Fe-S cluster assembly ATP-binding protein
VNGKPLLEIEDLVVEVEGKRLLDGIDMDIHERTTGGSSSPAPGASSSTSNRGYVMIQGRLMCSGPPRDIFTQIRRHGFGACIQEFEQGGDDHD